VRPRFVPGDTVRVRQAEPLGHCRTPGFVRGHSGRIERVLDEFPNPEERAYGRPGLPKVRLYRVRFSQPGLWPDYDGPAGDTLDVEIYEHWLEPAGP